MKVLPLYLPHQGCSHQCVYCNQPLTVGTMEDRPEWQSRLDQTLDHCTGHSWEIAFFGGTFSALPPETMERYLAEAAPYLPHESVLGIRISTRPDAVSDDTLTFLWQRGVRTIELGVESLDDAVLRKSARGHSAAQAQEACARVKAYGFQLGIHLMCGLPGQNRESWRDTVEESLTLNVDMVRIAPTLVLRETPLEKLYQKGLYQPLPLEEAIEQCAYAYRRFYQYNIPIVRMGLALSDGEGCGEDKIVAGPWHPALRHEVESRLVRERVLKALRQSPGDILHMNPKDISIAQGEGRKNLLYWECETGIRIRVQQDAAIKRYFFQLNDESYSLFLS